VEEAAAQAIAGMTLPKNRQNFHAVYLRTRRLIVVRFHIPFWRRVFETQAGNKKTISPERKKWPTIASDC
jgi:hypothetical protein